MGNSNQHKFDSHNWQFQSKPANYDIVQDQRSGIRAEKHVIPNNPTISEDDEMEVYHYRNLTNKPIVKVYDAEYAKGKAGACGAAKDIVVHSQYMPHRLSDVKNLNHGQALYVMSQALAGFHELHHRFGPFQITDDHIGFNQIGQAKVWHSPNFATNHLDRNGIILMSTTNPKNFDERMERRQEEQMVEDIWMAVDQHANISPEFTAKANYFRERNFNDARRLVFDEIARGATYVPDYLNFGGRGVGQSGINQSGINQSYAGQGYGGQGYAGQAQSQVRPFDGHQGTMNQSNASQNQNYGQTVSYLPQNTQQSQQYQQYSQQQSQPQYNQQYNQSQQFQQYNQSQYNQPQHNQQQSQVVSYGHRDDHY